MSKTRTTSRRPHRLAPDVGGGGYLSNPEFRVKSFFAKRPTKPPKPPKGDPSNPKRPSREEGQSSQEDLLNKD